MLNTERLDYLITSISNHVAQCFLSFYDTKFQVHTGLTVSGDHSEKLL